MDKEAFEKMIENSLDKTNFDQVLANKLDHIQLKIDEAKAEGKDSVHYPFFVPNFAFKRHDGFKSRIIDELKARGNHVTNFLPGFKDAFNGTMRDMFICWTDEAKAEAEKLEGYEFK